MTIKIVAAQMTQSIHTTHTHHHIFTLDVHFAGVVDFVVVCISHVVVVAAAVVVVVVVIVGSISVAVTNKVGVTVTDIVIPSIETVDMEDRS